MVCIRQIRVHHAPVQTQQRSQRHSLTSLLFLAFLSLCCSLLYLPLPSTAAGTTSSSTLQPLYIGVNWNAYHTVFIPPPVGSTAPPTPFRTLSDFGQLYNATVRMAIAHVNASPELTRFRKQYRLDAIFMDCNDNATLAAQQIQQMKTQNNIVALIGDYSEKGGGARAAQTDISLPITRAQIAAAYDNGRIPIMSPFNTTSIFASFNTSHLHQLYPPDFLEARAMIDFVLSYGWTGVAIVVSDDEYGSQAKEAVLFLAARVGISVVSSVTVPAVASSHATFVSPLKDLYTSMSSTYAARGWTNQPKVVLAFVTPLVALDLFSVAYSQAALSADFVWIISNSLMKVMKAADLAGRTLTNGMIAVSPLPSYLKQDALLVDQWPFYAPFAPPSSTTAPDTRLTADDFVPYVYDAIWTIAHALDTALVLGMDVFNGTALSTIINSDLNDRVGATGSIHFSTTGLRTSNRFGLYSLRTDYPGSSDSSSSVPGDLVGDWTVTHGVNIYQPSSIVFLGASKYHPLPSMKSNMYSDTYNASSTFNANTQSASVAASRFFEWVPSPLTGLPPSLRYGACSVYSPLRSSVFIFGGTVASVYPPYNDLYEFSFLYNRWEKKAIQSGAAPTGRDYMGCILSTVIDDSGVSEEMIFVYGGATTVGIRGDLWRFRISTNSWVSILMPDELEGISDRAQFATSATPQGMIAFSGQHRITRRNELWTFNTQTHAWSIQFPTYHSSSPSLNPQQSSPILTESAVARTFSSLIYPLTARAQMPLAGLNQSMHNTTLILGGYQQDMSILYAYDEDSYDLYSLNTTDKGTLRPGYRSLVNAVVRPSYQNAVSNASTDPILTRIGGRLWFHHGWSQFDNTNYDDVWSLDVSCPQSPTCGQWRHEGSFADMRDSFTSLSIGSDLFSFGGWGENSIHNDLWLVSTLTSPATPFLLATDIISPPARASHSAVLISNQMVIFGGRDANGARDDLWAFNLDTEQWRQIIVTGETPAPRFGHSAVTLNNDLYLFGGRSSASESKGTAAVSVLYGDLWRFSLTQSSWTLLFDPNVETTPSPPPRAFHQAVTVLDSYIFISGGQDASNYIYTDVWNFDVLNGWSVLVPDQPSDCPALIQAAAASDPQSSQTVITSGLQPTVDCTSGDPQLLNYFPTPVSEGASAVMQVGGDSIWLMVGGLDSGLNPVAEVYGMVVASQIQNDASNSSSSSSSSNVTQTCATDGTCSTLSTNYNWQLITRMPLGRSLHSAVVTGTQLIVFGGLYYEVCHTSVLVYEFTLGIWYEIDASSAATAPTPRADFTMLHFGRRLFAYGGAGSEFDNIYATNYLLPETWSFSLGHICEDDTIGSSQAWQQLRIQLQNHGITNNSVSSVCSICSPGTYHDRATCTSCPVGRYNSMSGRSSCDSCLPGFFSIYQGAATIDSCQPCASGYYQPLAGSSSCIQCEAGQYCPVGSSSVLNETSQAGAIEHSQSQPIGLRSSAMTVMHTTVIIAYCLVAVVVILVAVYGWMAFGTMKQIRLKREQLSGWDILFSEAHYHRIGRSMFRQATGAGGVMTLLAAGVMLYFIITLSLPYASDNYSETEALLPSVVLRDANGQPLEFMSAVIIAQVKLQSYRATCLRGESTTVTTAEDDAWKEITVGSCSAGVQTSFSVGTFTAFNFNSYCISEGSYSNPTRNCTQVWVCQDCSMTTDSSLVTFSFVEPRTFTPRISWSVSSSSGFPDQVSTVEGALLASDSYMFRGTSPPTLISLLATRTQFIENYSNHSSMGYHIQYSSAQPGHQVEPIAFNSFNGVLVSIAINRTAEAFIIQQDQKQSFLMFFVYLIATLFGVIGGFGFLLVYLEKFETAVLRFFKKGKLSSKFQLQKTQYYSSDKEHNHLAGNLEKAKKAEEARTPSTDSNPTAASVTPATTTSEENSSVKLDKPLSEPIKVKPALSPSPSNVPETIKAVKSTSEAFPFLIQSDSNPVQSSTATHSSSSNSSSSSPDDVIRVSRPTVESSPVAGAGRVRRRRPVSAATTTASRPRFPPHTSESIVSSSDDDSDVQPLVRNAHRIKQPQRNKQDTHSASGWLTSSTPVQSARPPLLGYRSTPRERRFVTSPLNFELKKKSSMTIEEIATTQPTTASEQPTDTSITPVASAPSSTIGSVKDASKEPSAIGGSSLNVSTTTLEVEVTKNHVMEYVSSQLEATSPIAVLFRKRRQMRQSVITQGRNSVAFVPTEEDNKIPQSSMLPLPVCCGGARNLQIPPYITGPMSSVVLPSRLDVLGRRDFKLMTIFDLHHVGNSVIGFAPMYQHVGNFFKKGGKVFRKQLFFLPSIFTRSTAYMFQFLKLLLSVIAVIGILAFFGIQFNIGYVWIIGTVLSLWVQYSLSRYKAKPDGVMSFCRSLGKPAIEEYMFSYCWKLQSENVRTLAKALWSSNVGCWIDVVKLTPGDEIRPMLRTVVSRVYRCVIFICPEYVASPNCCIELQEAVLRPEKLLFCIIKEPLDHELVRFMDDLVIKGAQIVRGFPELIKQLDKEVNDEHNIDYFQWWQTQDISGAGVPEEVVPTAEWPIPKFSFTGRKFLPEKSLTCGPIFLAGDCSDAGLYVAIPWLLIGALAACAICFYALINAFLLGNPAHDVVDYMLLICILGINVCPIVLGGKDLIDTRRYIHATLRPLLASRAVGGGVLVQVIGDSDDIIVQILKKFLLGIGHLKPSASELDELWEAEMARNAEYDSIFHTMETDDDVFEKERRVRFLEEHHRLTTNTRVLKIIVMDTLESRLKYFSTDQTENDASCIYVWSGPGDPFTKDKVGERLMRFLVLVAAWERQNLAEAIGAALAVRCVDLMHKTATTTETAHPESK